MPCKSVLENKSSTWNTSSGSKYAPVIWPDVSKLTIDFPSNTTAYPRSYVGPVGAATVYPFQSDLTRIDTAVVFVTKYSREGYDLTSLKVSHLF